MGRLADFFHRKQVSGVGERVCLALMGIERVSTESINPLV